MRSVLHQRGKIFGIALCVVLVLSVYAGFVGFVSDLFGHDFIKAVSLSSRANSDGSYRFMMGDTITVSAKVRFSNVYRVSVYDNSSRHVFEAAGSVNSPDVQVSIPLYPPAFNSSHTYSLVFEAAVSNYPLLGVNAYDFSPAESFTVVKSLTRLDLTASYGEATHELRSVAFLTTSDGLPVENGTVSFYMQPNVDFVRPDRGWTFLDSVQTGADGSASYSCALGMMGGCHGLQARFVGDQGFASSIATSRFNVSYRPTQLRIVRVDWTVGSVSVVLQLTDPSGFPLGGKCSALRLWASLRGLCSRLQTTPGSPL